MDLNYVFLRQQIERSLADAADSAAARSTHLELARAYELKIERKSGGRIVFPSNRTLGSDSQAEEPIRTNPVLSARP